MRAKKWAKPELSVCPFYIQENEKKEHKGNWNKLFKNDNPIYLELGCGKGIFLSLITKAYPKINFIGVDLISNVLAVARRNIVASLETEAPDNILLLSQDIEKISDIFGEGDKFDRIYISFPNPWYKHSQYKKRLTHTRQILQYKTFLKQGGEIWFKTDHDALFNDSIEYFNECGFNITYKTYDLMESGFEENFTTEHEQMYIKEGIKIKFLIAKMQ